MKNGEESPRNRLRKRLESVTEAPQLGFFSRKQFFSLILRDFSIPEGLLPPEGTAFFWNTREGPSGLGCYLHPIFTKYTPSWCFFIDFFLKRCGTLRITQ